MKDEQNYDLVIGYKVLSVVFGFAALLLAALSFKNFRSFTLIHYIIMGVSFLCAIVLNVYCSKKSKKLSESISLEEL